MVYQGASTCWGTLRWQCIALQMFQKNVSFKLSPNFYNWTKVLAPLKPATRNVTKRYLIRLQFLKFRYNNNETDSQFQRKVLSVVVVKNCQWHFEEHHPRASEAKRPICSNFASQSKLDSLYQSKDSTPFLGSRLFLQSTLISWVRQY